MGKKKKRTGSKWGEKVVEKRYSIICLTDLLPGWKETYVREMPSRKLWKKVCQLEAKDSRRKMGSQKEIWLKPRDRPLDNEGKGSYWDDMGRCGCVGERTSRWGMKGWVDG